MKKSFLFGTLITLATVFIITSLMFGSDTSFCSIYKMKLTSTTFNNNERLPREQAKEACGGKDISPDLDWGEIPDGTQSFAIIVQDIDTKARGGFYHWILLDIPANRTSVARGENVVGARALKNDYQHYGYTGPCPQYGEHRYSFTVYALDTAKLDVTENDLPKDIEAKAAYHAIETAKLIGVYKKYGN